LPFFSKFALAQLRDTADTCLVASTSSHKPTLAQKRKLPKIVFECEPEFRRQVDIALAEKQMSIREAGRIAFSRYLKIQLPGASPDSTAVA
jgi:hypothetical protein